MPGLVYNGRLTRDVSEAIQRSEYASAIELRSFPPKLDDIFEDKTWVQYGEDCMGQETSHVRAGIPWGWISKNFGSDEDRSGFLMVPSEADKARIVEAFPDLVVNANPFGTRIDARSGDRRGPTVVLGPRSLACIALLAMFAVLLWFPAQT